MDIVLEQVGKRYRLEWIFRGIDFRFQGGQRYALLGPNGSGKSTLLKVLSGHVTPSKGDLSFQTGGTKIEAEQVYKQISYAAPYIELIEEFTLEEALNFHFSMRPLLPGLQIRDLTDILALPRAKGKEIRQFSSGMKQRVKLVLALCTDTPVLLLDEPATNLDLQGIAWYKSLIEQFAAERLVIIASNDPHDAEFCPTHLNILDYKKK